MKTKLFFLTLLSCFVFLPNCTKEESGIDLTERIVGEYIGLYSSPDVGTLDPFTLSVTRVNNETISLAPISKDVFSKFDSGIKEANNIVIGGVGKDIQGKDENIYFTVTVDSVKLIIHRKVAGNSQLFIGKK